jgi:HK97 family phage major capsid protein|uniref:Major capsid protein n=1 Tax=Siphoviridae sp. ctGuJ10 TaxID=2825418 RepID=A0A8S5PUA8_9CAUD|nr:MAG TPA: major capsid protein [Siphoviridae sp. ctGuJ10]
MDTLMEQIKNLQTEVRSLLDAGKIDEAESKMSEVRSLKERLKLMKEVEENERSLLLSQGNPHQSSLLENRINKDDSRTQLRSVVKYAMGKELSSEEREAVLVKDNLAAIPEEYVNQLQILKDGYPSLKQYCHVVPVSSPSGRMPFSKIGGKRLSKLTDGNAIPNGTPSKVEQVKYDVDDYGDLMPISNDLTDDEVVDIVENVIKADFAESAVNTENDEIMGIVNASKSDIAGKDYGDIENVIDTISPNLRMGTIIITNTNSYGWLNNLKDKDNKRLDLVKTINGKRYFHERELVELSNDDIQPATEGNYVFYVVNLFALVKFFDRKAYSLAISDQFFFGNNQKALRVLERFDTQKLDDRACKKIEIPSTTVAPASK